LSLSIIEASTVDWDALIPKILYGFVCLFIQPAVAFYLISMCIFCTDDELSNGTLEHITAIGSIVLLLQCGATKSVI